MRNSISMAVLAVLLVSASATGFSMFSANTHAPSGTAVYVTVKASDKLDPYLRDWNLFIDRAPGQYLGGGVFSGGKPDYVKYEYSGMTATYKIYLTPGTHTIYLDIGQSGGSKYGVYNGTMSISALTYTFNGLNVNVPFARTVIVN
jgi:hypothetical protein